MFAIRALALLLLTAVVLPTLAQDKKKEEAKFDASKMLGEWNITGGKKMGKEISDDGKKGNYTITKDKITLKEDGKDLFVFSYTIDAKTTPVSIDMEITESAIDGLKGSKAKGIVELKGDELKLCYEPMDGARPKKFDDESCNSFVLKKKAKKDD